MPVKSQNDAHPVVGACEIARCRTDLDELSSIYSETSTRRVACPFVHAQGPSELALVLCTLKDRVKRQQGIGCIQT